ncbi:MAG: exodeoxyribonuclease VII small subunit [Candidatus Eisenbacteria bacterium]
MSAKKKEEKIDWEKSVGRLEEIVKSLEGGGAGLDESLKLFEEGTTLVKALEKALAEAELKVKKLVEGEGGNPKEEPFAEEGE